MLDKYIELKDTLAKKNGVEKERIKIWEMTRGRYGLDIDGTTWSEYLTGKELEDQLYCIFKGIKMIRKNIKGD